MITFSRRILFIVLTIFIVPHTSCASFAAVKSYFSKIKSSEPENKIGVIKLTEDINREMIEKIIKKIESFGQDQSIKGILLVINSSGGSSAASELIFREIKELAKIKPVVSFAIINCESGAYKVATASNWIIALSTSSVGGIGTIITVERRKNARIKGKDIEAETDYELFHGGKYKTMYCHYAPALTDEERGQAQALANDDYKIFYTCVAQQRKLSLEKLHEWADGQYFNGDTALQLGLIDQIGGYSDAIQKLREMVEAKGIKLKEKLTFVE